MTDAIVCDRCGAAVERDEWKRHVHATIDIGFIAATDTGNYERGPREFDLCGPCTNVIETDWDLPIPTRWSRVEPESDDGESEGEP